MTNPNSLSDPSHEAKLADVRNQLVKYGIERLAVLEDESQPCNILGEDLKRLGLEVEPQPDTDCLLVAARRKKVASIFPLQIVGGEPIRRGEKSMQAMLHDMRLMPIAGIVLDNIEPPMILGIVTEKPC